MANSSNKAPTGERRRNPMACRYCRANKQKCEPQTNVSVAGSSACARCVKRGRADDCVYIAVALENADAYGGGDQQGFYGSTTTYHTPGQAQTQYRATGFVHTTVDARGQPVTGNLETTSVSPPPTNTSGYQRHQQQGHGMAAPHDQGYNSVHAQQVPGPSYYGTAVGMPAVYTGYEHPQQQQQQPQPHDMYPQTSHMGMHQPQHTLYPTTNPNQYGAVQQHGTAPLNWAYANPSADVNLYSPYSDPNNGQNSEEHTSYDYTSYSYARQT